MGLSVGVKTITTGGEGGQLQILRTAGDLLPRSRVRGTGTEKLLRGDMKGGGFFLNQCHRIVAEGRPG